ncbi:MAG TPA: tetratricopeptide repeat protein [Acidobacteriota bacterium]|nr:tetratricopeptide repeat protein [Acidobacteriota bacterium]
MKLTMTRLLLFSSFSLCLAAGPAAVVANDLEEQYRQAQEARAAEDFEQALTLFEQALAENPDSLRLASEYRMTVIEAGAYDRALAFFQELTSDNPQAAYAFLNYGLAYVDKIPSAGSITQVLLANKSLKHFTRSVEIRPTWLGLYTRGNSYLFWPKVFNRAPLGVADLEKAYAMQQDQPKRSYHLRVYLSLGDGYYKVGREEEAKAMWRKGLSEFPSSRKLKRRVEASGEALAQVVDAGYDPNVRVDSDLRELWSQQQPSSQGGEEQP